MKICFIVGSFPYMDCGVGDYTSMVAHSLAKKNEVSVITSKAANNKLDDIKVYNIIESFDENSISIIIDKLKEINPDVVHFQYPSHGFNNRRITSIMLPLEIKKQFPNLKIVETIHEYPKYTKEEKLEFIKNYEIFDKIIFVEDYYKDLVKKDFEDLYEKLSIDFIPIGSNIPKSEATKEEKEELKKKLGLEDSYILSYFGFARQSKGIETLFKALKKQKDKNIKLLYIGDLNDENAYQHQLLKLIKKLKIEKQIVMTGYIKEKEKTADYLSISDVCVLPYRGGLKERYGSFLAACNQNVKIITTSVKKIDDNDGIYYVKPDHPRQLAKKIKSVIYNRNIISNKTPNSWDDIALKYLNAYKFID